MALKESCRNAKPMQLESLNVAQGSVTIEPNKAGDVGERHTGKVDVQLETFLYACIYKD